MKARRNLRNTEQVRKAIRNTAMACLLYLIPFDEWKRQDRILRKELEALGE